MENLSRLFLTIEKDSRLEEIGNILISPNPSLIRLSGMVGGLDSFALSEIHRKSKLPILIIMNDKEEAAYLYNDLENIYKKDLVFFLPDSFRYPLNFERLSSSNVLHRTDVVNKMTDSNDPHIVVSYPEALFEKVVDPEELKKNKIVILKEEEIDLDFLIEILVEYAFERVDFVYEPGQFSIRGGIVDIFSYGNEWPYRIELFDETVETIRIFDPSTQISRKEISRLSIVPDINRKFSPDAKVPIFDVLPEKAIVVINDFDLLLDKLQICFDKVDDFSSHLLNLENEELKKLLTERSFLYPKDVMENIHKNHIISLKQELKIPGRKSNHFTFESKPQPIFNRNFSMLIENLKENSKNGLENFIFTANQKQIERFYNIFQDLEANVHFHPIIAPIHQGFVSNELKIAVFTDHQIFERFHRYKLKRGFTKDQALNLRMLRSLKPGDFVTHIDHGIGKYSGLEKIEVTGHVQESVRLIYKNNDILYVSINSLHKISKYGTEEGKIPVLSKIGGDTWKNLKRKTKRKVKDIAKELISLYAQRKAAKGFPFAPDGYLQNELEASFIYEDTPDQLQATIDTKADMEKPHPMDRLICGDVGFGKTEVAIRAAFKCVINGKQVAILVPTTILALQHYNTISERLKEFGVTVDYLNRFRSAAEKKLVYEKTEKGEIEILIGTHALLNKKVKFKNLGLLVVDEEQKFGVSAKEKIRSLTVNVDTLTLTATPIPRTLQFSLMAARDLSIIRTPPPNRQPIHTENRIFNDKLIRESVYFEINRGGQVFFVHNRIKNLPDLSVLLKKLCPEAEIEMAHGQMDSKKLEKTLIDFIDHKFDVLVSTNIIETGLDIPNVNTIIINNAHQFGMSDLHQLRGRVGRSNRKAYCYLFSPPLSVLTSDARKRLKTLEELSDLGSGFEIAMKDLDIRGAGNMLGAEQSGFISDIGFEAYQKILDEAISELKENEFIDLFKEEIGEKRIYVRDVVIETDIEMLIPDNYISNIQERLILYTRLDNISKEEDLIKFSNDLQDRFGPIPSQVKELFEGLRLRWKCKEMGFERLTLKGNKLRGYFVQDPQSKFFESQFFQGMLQFVAEKGPPLDVILKQSPKFLIFIKNRISSLSGATDFFEEIYPQIMSYSEKKEQHV